MKCYALVNSRLEELARQEIKELVNASGKISPNVIEFELKDKEGLLNLSKRVQSARRLLVSLGEIEDIDKFEFKKRDWKTILPKKFKFKVEVEGVKGQENRVSIAHEIAGKFFEIVGDGLEPEIELKNPELLLVVYFNSGEYFVGLDFNIEELNSRKYRVFAHQASFKGDLAYFFARKSGFKPGDKLLLGFCKDGTIAIEAARFAEQKIIACDESRQNVTAASKNVKLAGMQNLVEVKKFSLDELDVKFGENEFDRSIFHVTTKDEVKINEIYYQASYILKKGGTLLLIGRENWELSISDKFSLLDKGKITKGDSVTKFWLLKKK